MKERINTGLTEIEEKLGGLKVGCVYIAAGRIAEGKTTFGAALVNADLKMTENAG